MADLFDCRKCGACCFSPWTGDAYVRLYDIDLERLQGTALPVIMQAQGDGDPPEVIPKLGTKMLAEGKRACVAFEGQVGESCACGIYPQRPEACRRYQAGDGLCRQARERLAIRP